LQLNETSTGAETKVSGKEFQRLITVHEKSSDPLPWCRCIHIQFTNMATFVKGWIAYIKYLVLLCRHTKRREQWNREKYPIPAA